MTSNVIPMFAFDDQQLRCTIIDGEPWFAAKDACDILGLKPNKANRSYQQHMRRLDSDEVRTGKIDDATTNNRSIYLVSRPGLFALISRSNKPEAKRFDRWVRHEVLLYR